MPLLCDWNTKVITVPKTELTLVSGTYYTLEVVKWFQLLRELNGAQEGIAETVHEPIYNNTPPTTSTPRIVDVINGYTCQIENGAYNLDFINGNTNWRQVEIKNEVGVGTNNTTGFIDPKFLEHNLFNGGVTIDVVNGYDINYNDLVGTPKYPSNNEIDANAIALKNGFTNIFVKGDLVLEDINIEWTKFIFIGESAIKSLITVDFNADVFNCKFLDCTLTDSLDGTSQIERSVVNALDFVDGYVYKCSIGPGGITLGTTSICNIFSCYTSTLNVPIDCNGTGRLALKDFNGDVLISNYNGNDTHLIELARGQAKLDTTTITSGTWVVRGIGKLTDELGNPIETGTWNGATIINELIDSDKIQLLLDTLHGDMIPTTDEWKILHKTTKEVLVQKNTNVVDGLTQLIEP